MDGISVATSVLAFATTSTHISIKLYSLSKQISNAPDTITFLANDVSMISGVLSQLGQLVQRDQTDGSQRIFSQAGLDLIDHSSQNCSKAFEDLSSMLDRATSQLARVSKSQKQTKINLSVPEKVRWPFLKADIKRLRADLQDAKSSLLLVLPLEHWIAIKKESSVDTQSKTKAALDMGSVKRTVEALWPEHTGHPSRPRESMSLQKSNTRGGGKEQDAHESDDASEEDDEDLQALESRSDMAFEMFASTKRSDPIDFDEVETVSFQLRPVAEEVNDKVEALWRSGVSRLAPNHLSGFFPREAVKHDALAGLYPSEQRAIWEVVESYGNEARIVSVKKTTWNLHIRDTVVKDVPGVQVLSLAKYGGYTDIDHTYPVAGYPAGNSELIRSYTSSPAGDISQAMERAIPILITKKVIITEPRDGTRPPYHTAVKTGDTVVAVGLKLNALDMLVNTLTETLHICLRSCNTCPLLQKEG